MKSFFKKVTTKISKLTPEQLEDFVETLTEENETYNAVLNSLHTGLLICNADWKLELKNKAVMRYIPMTATNNIDPVWELIDNLQISEFLHQNCTNQKKNISQDFLVFDSNNASRFLSVDIFPLVRSNKLWGYIIQVDDITEKRKQEILIRRMESMASLTNLAASVAHEIKNPLGAISIHIQLIQKALTKAREKDGILPDEKHTDKYLHIVNEEIERLNNIIVDFLAAVRPVRVTMEPSNPTKLLETFKELIEPELQEKQISLNIDLMSFPQLILVDPKMFNQVLVNLAQNAIHAMTNGGSLHIITSIKNDRFTLVFRDTGCGMNESTLSRVFEPYFTTRAQGTGLGLSLVYKIVKEMAGDISVKSEIGKGTDFTLTFPLLQREQKLLEYEQIGG